MPRLPLPQNYLLDDGTLIYPFNSTAGWTLQTDNDGTMVLDTENTRPGSTASLKLSVTNNGASRYVSITRSDLSFQILPKTLTLWAYIHVPPSVVGQLVVTIAPVSNLSRFFRASYALTVGTISVTRMVPGWNRLVIHRDQLTITGSPSWSETMNTIKIALYAASGAIGQTFQASIDNLRYDEESMPRVVFTFDGLWQSIYTNAFPIMEAAGIKGTTYIVSNLVGTGGEIQYATLANLTELYDAGWTLGNHTDDHTNLVGLTKAQVLGHIQACENFLLSNGFTRGAKYFNYPYGTYDATVLEAVRESGAVCTRSVSTSLQHSVGTPHILQIYQLGGKTLTEAKSVIDLAIKYGATVIFYLDNVVESDPGPTGMTTADFQALIDYIVARKVKCITIDEWYEGLTDPRYRSIPLARAVV